MTLRVSLQEEDSTQVLLRFEVSDTGPGIAPESLARLFNPFEQADSSTTRKYGGTGLGLTITKGIAQTMQGEAGATSVPGQGSGSAAQRSLPWPPHIADGRRADQLRNRHHDA